MTTPLSPELVYHKQVSVSDRLLSLQVVDTSSPHPSLGAHHLLLVTYSITDHSSLAAASDLLRTLAPLSDPR